MGSDAAAFEDFFRGQTQSLLYATGDGACRTVGCGPAGAEGGVALHSIGVDGSDARLVVAGDVGGRLTDAPPGWLRRSGDGFL